MKEIKGIVEIEEETYFEMLDNQRKQQQEIERLNNIINEYKNANEYHQNIIHELETMKQPNQLYSENVKLTAENNRLNNILNDFEEELERELNIKEEDTGLEHNTYIDIRNTLKSVLKRLQELKGSDKE